MSNCIIIDCTEVADIEISNPSTGQTAMICKTHAQWLEMPEDKAEEE